MAPDLWRRMMRGEITPVEARREWAEREPAQRRFNDQLRSAAGVGFVADAEAVLSQAGTTGAPGASSRRADRPVCGPEPGGRRRGPSTRPGRDCSGRAAREALGPVQGCVSPPSGTPSQR